jgi:hypothetical protein
VSKRQFPWLLIGILIVGYAVGHVLGLILAALGLGIAYFATLRIHPRIRHTGFRGCGGTGEHRGSIFTWRFRKCPRCNSGRLISYGAGHWGADHIKSEYARTKQARAAAKDGNRWR